jgi:hypothetical protein
MQDVGDDRAAPAVAVEAADALVEDFRGPVEFAQHADVADLLESVDAGAGAQGHDQHSALPRLERGDAGGLLVGGFGAGVQDGVELGQALQPDAVHGPVPPPEDDPFLGVEEQADELGHVGGLGHAGGLAHLQVEFTGGSTTVLGSTRCLKGSAGPLRRCRQ